MNRQQRRSEERQIRRFKTSAALKVQAYRASNRPMLHEVHSVFDPVEQLLKELGTGMVSCDERGVPIIKPVVGQYCQAAPALLPLINALSAACAHYQIEIDFSPAIKLTNRLDCGMPITPELVGQAKAVFRLAKQAYMRMDACVVKSFSITEQIKIAVEDSSLTKPAEAIV